MIWVSFNPLCSNIQTQILQTDLYTLPCRISLENLIKDQSILHSVIMFILITFSSDDVLI